MNKSIVARRSDIAIHADAGVDTGLGHVRRCLSLAVALRRRGKDVHFVIDANPIVANQVTRNGFEVTSVGSEFDPARIIDECGRENPAVVIIDSYKFQTDHFCALMARGPLVAVIDDLAGIGLPVNMIINGSIGAVDLSYQALDDTRFLLGPEYVLLRPEFADCPSRNVSHRVERVLITVGGSDPHNLTPRLIEWTSATLGAINIDVIIGPLFDNVAEIESARRQRTSAVDLHADPDDVKSLMLAANLAISGGGQTTYELAASATPTVAIRLFENQTANLKGFQERGALVWVGDVGDPNLEDQVRSSLSELASDPESRRELSAHGRSLIDGRGATRTANAILTLMENF